MSTKLETVLKLLKKAEEKGQSEMTFVALCEILEIYDESPDSLDPVVRALVPTFIRPLVESTEKSLLESSSFQLKSVS